MFDTIASGENPRPQIAALTLETGRLTDDDQLLVAPLLAQGCQLTAVSWHDRNVDWHQFSAILIRSTWDYHRSPQTFLDFLLSLVEGGTPIFNPLELVRWNVDKRYLCSLSKEGIPVVPTRVLPGLDPHHIERALSEFDAQDFVIKPLIGASADQTFRLSYDTWRAQWQQVFVDPKDAASSNSAQREFMLQPFMETVIEQGEFSLFYFDGTYSHAIIKRPQPGDFRVQEEYGGQSIPIDPPEAAQRLAEETLSHLATQPLYARVDIIPDRTPDRFLLMELELIEPALYLSTHPLAAERLAAATICQLERAR